RDHPDADARGAEHSLHYRWPERAVSRRGSRGRLAAVTGARVARHRDVRVLAVALPQGARTSVVSRSVFSNRYASVRNGPTGMAPVGMVARDGIAERA